MRERINGIFIKCCWYVKEYIPFIKINSQQLIDLNIRAETIKFLEEDRGVNLHDLGLDSGSLDMTSKV